MAPVAHSHIISAGIAQEESRIRSQTDRDAPQASLQPGLSKIGGAVPRLRRDKQGTASHGTQFNLSRGCSVQCTVYSIVDCLLSSDLDQFSSKVIL